ncbi:hypothetical protein L5G28_01025 [Gordonia sp. HY285]|uniref:2-isopropylmalate synthase LeuA allosteric (dimerisation) domain-containing protein n=1 Tax=Gordonia liuliyuniae TaxID=2911517 RepID=A0ABS9IPF4_9ACTN|nr:hypothetical protein [Gordonia liuliyuniae]MCF8587429.1 hypothetical protein [Gordonia liuliyuniae]MCF8608747.1 hypothetical protein [Gordonia liuliyuniae]
MTTAHFDTTYAPTGAIALEAFQFEHGRADTIHCTADIRIAHRKIRLSATASGVIGAMTSMLYDIDAGVEIVALSQQVDDDEVTTYLRCNADGRRCWSYGIAGTADESAVAALISGANQLSKR